MTPIEQYELELEIIGIFLTWAGVITTLLLVGIEKIKEKKLLKENEIKQSQIAIVYWLNLQIIWLIFGICIFMVIQQKFTQMLQISFAYTISATFIVINDYLEIHRGYNFYLYCFEMENMK